ncbi:N-acetylmuramic acid 6-phosphate etherase [Caproiciproducens sp.]
MTDLSHFTTEARNPETMNLDRMSAMEIVSVMNREDEKVIAGVRAVLPQIAKTVEYTVASLQSGGRIIYIGAGTSGRLGVLDASECPPTFGVSADTVVGLIAGGKGALIEAVEGAEDSCTLGGEDLKRIGLKPCDTVIGLAASGRTPYVLYGLRYARQLGCRTAAIACNRDSAVGKEADVAIEPDVGPEVLTGSTRLKSGTAQKMILNMISTASMVKIGHTYENLMVNMQASNEKLTVRAQNMVMAAAKCGRETAETALREAGGRVKTAIVLLLLNVSAEKGEQALARAHGRVREALAGKLQ